MSDPMEWRTIPKMVPLGGWQVIPMNARGRFGRLLLAAVLLTSLPVRADEPRRCAALADDRARLACYDSIFGKPAAVPAPAGAATGTVAAAPAAATAANPAADFGLTEAAKRALEPEESRQRLPESISGTVAKVARQPAGELVLTLENGQVWTQLQVDVRARVAVGDPVTIKKAALGSYLLVTEDRYATRVRRVK